MAFEVLVPPRKWRTVVVFCCLLLAPAESVRARDIGVFFGEEPYGDQAVSARALNQDDTECVEPWIHPSMPRSVKTKLESAFDLALERVNEVSACAELFTRLEADAVKMLKKGLYLPASPARETTICRRSLAQTYVGGSSTFICRRVTSYPDEEIAVMLIHEALHHAGLSEDNVDRDAMSGGAISQLVGKHCRL